MKPPFELRAGAIAPSLPKTETGAPVCDGSALMGEFVWELTSLQRSLADEIASQAAQRYTLSTSAVDRLIPPDARWDVMRDLATLDVDIQPPTAHWTDPLDRLLFQPRPVVHIPRDGY